MIKQKVALVLGSGGARGIAHIGVISELEKQGFSITSVSGSSMGALIGGFYAMGRIHDVENLLLKLDKTSVYRLFDLTLSSKGLIKGERVFKMMKDYIPDMLIEDMNIPFAAVATNLISREETVFRKGSFYKAARASIAIPAIITPVVYKNTILVDGGVLNPVPLNRVARTEGDILVAVNLYDSHANNSIINSKNENHNEKKKKKSESNLMNMDDGMIRKIKEFIPNASIQNPGYYTLIQLTSSIMLEKISGLSLIINKPDILVNIPITTARAIDFHKASELIDAGIEAAALSINEFYLNKSNDN